MTMLTVLGIDQSLSSCGYAVLHGQDVIVETRLEQYKGLRTKREKFVRHGNNVQTLIKSHNPQIIITEQVRAYHSEVIAALASLNAITMVATPSTIPIFTLNTSTWKREMLGAGMGNAEKQVSIDAILNLYNQELPEDVCEAILMARFGVTKYSWLLNLTAKDRGKARRIA